MEQFDSRISIPQGPPYRQIYSPSTAMFTFPPMTAAMALNCGKATELRLAPACLPISIPDQLHHRPCRSLSWGVRCFSPPMMGAARNYGGPTELRREPIALPTFMPGQTVRPLSVWG